MLLDGQLGRRQSLEALVGDRLAALGGEAVGPGREPRLRALEHRELRGEILCQTRVELFLVEVLGASVLSGSVKPNLQCWQGMSGYVRESEAIALTGRYLNHETVETIGRLHGTL